MSTTRERFIGVMSQLIVFGLRIPFTRGLTVFSKTCDEYDWMEMMRTFRAMIDDPPRNWSPVYRGVVELVTLNEGDLIE